jgi:hypothetical protein
MEFSRATERGRKMAREIKFCARNKNTREIIYWSSNNGDTGFWDEVGIFPDQYDLVEEWTGRTDTNGNEIYITID